MAMETDAVSDSSPSASLRSELRQGWRVVLGAMLGLATGLPLYLYTQGFFVAPLAEAFGWSRGEISLGASAGLLGILATPLAGWLSDRFGVRRVAGAGFAALCIGYVALSQLRGELWHFYLCLLVMHIFAPAATAIVLTRPVAQAFSASRGLALGIAAGGSAICIMVLAPSLQIVVAHAGWRAAYLTLAAISGVVGAVAMWLLPMSARASASNSAGSGAGSLVQAMQDRRFWLMVLAMLTANLAFGGLLNQLPALLNDRGFEPVLIGLVMSTLTGAAAAGRLLEGIAVDRMRPSIVAFVSLLIPVAGLLLLRASQEQTHTFIAVALIGAGLGAEGTMLGFLTARFFGLRAYGAVFGALAAPINIALAAGGGLFGFMYDRTQTYDIAIAIAAGGMAVAAVSLLSTGLTPRARSAPA